MTLRIGNKEFDEKVVQDMIDAGLLGIGAKHDTSSSTPSATPTHGPFPGNNTQFGIFSGPGVRPGMWNATPRVRTLMRDIPLQKSTFMQELIDVGTGVTAGSGNNQTSACMVGPKPGQLSKMQILATYGMIHESTKIFDLTQAGMRRNRADVDREFFNAASADNPWLPQVPGMDGTGFVNSTLRSEMFALSTDVERSAGGCNITGVAGTQDNTFRGVATQWNGLDQLIKQNWRDAVTNSLVPAADAAITLFNSNVDGSDQYGRGINQAVGETFFGQIDFLNRLGVAPFFKLYMRADLFREIAFVWACNFATNRCLTGATAGNPVTRDGESIRRMAIDMLDNMYLPMEGVNVPVGFDDSIPRDTLGNGYYQSDIYGVALSGNGIPTLYGDYFDMNNYDADEIANAFGLSDGTTTTLNNGLYRVFKRVTGGCIEYDFISKPRLITDAPFMHFKIDNVWYKTNYRQTDAQPNFSYYRGGGQTYVS